MKKLVLALVIVAMFLQLGTVAFAAGTQDSYTLLTHWDFEGDTPYADKATGGASSDALTANGAVTIEDGVAFIPQEEGNYIMASGAADTDLNSMANKTVLIKVKLIREPNTNLVSGFISKEGVFSYGVYGATTGDSGATPYGSVIYYNGIANVKAGDPLTCGEYRVFAMTFSYDETTQKTTIKQYMSTKEVPASADDFALVNELADADNVKLSSTGDFILGKRNTGHYTKNRQLPTYVDDVKIFDGVLTVEQLVAESPTTTVGGTPTGGENDSTGGEGDDITPITPVIPNGSTNNTDNTEKEETGDTTSTQGVDESANTTDDTTADAENGCGSSVAIGVVGVVAIASALTLSRKKRK